MRCDSKLYFLSKRHAVVVNAKLAIVNVQMSQRDGSRKKSIDTSFSLIRDDDKNLTLRASILFLAVASNKGTFPLWFRIVVSAPTLT